MTGTDEYEKVRRSIYEADDLRHSLSAAHAELIDIEALVRLHGPGLLAIDRAEDLRRNLAGPRIDQATGIRASLASAESTLVEHAVEGQTDLGRARTMTALTLQSAKEVRHLQIELARSAVALEPLAQSSATQEFSREARDGIEAAMTALDHARRSACRVSEDLPLIARAVINEPDPTPTLSLAPVSDGHLLRALPDFRESATSQRVGRVPSVER